MSKSLEQLLDLLGETDIETVGTSVRLPANLRRAASLAVEMGMGESTTDLTVRGLRDALEAFAQQAILDDHYRQFPEARPDLADVAIATAEIDGISIAQRPDLIRHAATRIVAIKRDPTPDEVLIYATGLAESAA